MIEITLNGKKQVLETSCVLAEALQQWGYQKDYYAVAINQIFISRTQYTEVILKTNDNIEIVAPMQGG